MPPMIGHALSIFMGFFAIMNPIANTPIFFGLTEGQSDEVRKHVAQRALGIAFLLVLVFALLGKLIFSMFGITLPAFRIMGGILVALIGYEMLHGQKSRVHHPISADPNTTDMKSALESAMSVAVTPLATPILAGPGTITTAMTFAGGGTTADVVLTIATFAILCAITYGFFVNGQHLVRRLGPTGLSVVTRLMGLILAVIGVQMVIDGIHGAQIFGQWKG